MRLDHLLSKEMGEVGVVLLSSCQGVHVFAAYGERPSASCPEGIARVRTVGAWTDSSENLSGGDALRGHTRSHPEHDG